MRTLYFIIISLLIVYSCESDKTYTINELGLAPKNTSVMIKTKSIESLKSNLKNNTLLKELSKYSQVKNFEATLNLFDNLNLKEDILICFGKDANDSLQISVITKFAENIINTKDVTNLISETITTDELTYTKTSINNQAYYSTMVDSLFFITNTLTHITSIHKELEADLELEKIYQTADKDKSLSIIVNAKNKRLIPSFFNDEDLNKNPFSDYYLFDADVSQNQIRISGITKATDSSKTLITAFKKTIPQENLVGKVTPFDADYFMSFTFDDFKTFSENLERIKKRDTIIETTIFDNASEIGLIKKNGLQALVIHSIDDMATQDAISYQNAIENFRDININTFGEPKLFSQTFTPLINFKSATYYAHIDAFFIFSDSVEFLKDIIASYQNNSNVYESKAYKNMFQDLSDESSLLIYSNAASLNSILNDNFSENVSLNLSGFNASAIQFIYDHDFAHINAVIKKHGSSASISNAVSELTNITLDADLLIEPQLVSNFTNNQKDIVVQDVNNNLYQISNEGKILFKKQLEGKILGQIEQIDIYKNGRLQLAFATSKRLYVLDRNGKDVTPFPLKFNDNITQPLSVFDYDNKKDYRLLVTQGKSLLMYDVSGKIVKGFTYKTAPNAITKQPQHFRIGKTDYIVFAHGNQMEIIDRVGKPRTTVKEKIDFSTNDIYLYDNKFTTSTTNGELVKVSENGQVSKENLKLVEKHFTTTTSKTLVTLSENILNIKSKKVELSFGDYTAPKIYYLQDKIYIATTDLQTNKAYLFDSQGEIITNFPVYGNSTLLLDNINKDNPLEAITKGSSNSIIVYQL